MKYIGSRLKQLRLDLGLTQTEMAAGVISVSFYSKVERGFNDIGAEELIEILQKHNVSFEDFFSGKIENKTNDKRLNILMNKFFKAANEDNDKELDNLITELEKIRPQTTFINSLIVHAKIIYDTHDESSMKNLTYEEKKKIKQKVFQKYDKENEYLRIVLISNVIQIYSVEEAKLIINSIIRRYKNTASIEKKLIVALSILMVNYIDLCFQRNEIDLCDEPLKYLKNLPNIIEVAFSKILGKYYEDIIYGKKGEAEEIKKVLVLSGYDVNVKRMTKQK